MFDSRTPTMVGEADAYVTSEPRNSYWGQPAASHYAFAVVGNRLFGQSIEGIYVPSRVDEEVPQTDGRLASEFASWEAASDEALSNFENSL